MTHNEQQVCKRLWEVSVTGPAHGGCLAKGRYGRVVLTHFPDEASRYSHRNQTLVECHSKPRLRCSRCTQIVAELSFQNQKCRAWPTVFLQSARVSHSIGSTVGRKELAD